MVVTPQRAELWLNGKREGVGALEQPLPQTAAPLTFGGVNELAAGSGRTCLAHWMGFVCGIHRSMKTEMAARYRPGESHA